MNLVKRLHFSLFHYFLVFHILKGKKLDGSYSSIISATCLSFSLPESQPQSQCDGTKYGNTRKGRSFMNMNRTSARNSKDDLQLISDKMLGCLGLKFTFSVIR